MNDFYIMKKKVDKSVLNQGMTIPQTFHEVFYRNIGFTLQHGESVAVKVMMNGAAYDVKVTNQGFDRQKYEGHSDVLQLRYDGNSLFKEALRSAFPTTWNRMTAYYAEHKTYTGFKTAASEEEYLSIYASAGTLLFECLPNGEYNEGVREIKRMDEALFESADNSPAYIEEKVGIRKIRHLSQSIGNSLKVIYGYRCQICGQFIGEKYGTTLVHAHHIDYFTTSLNNQPDNILVVCPNHHGIIHSTNPVFDRSTQRYTYPNGYTEGLMLNVHIGTSNHNKQ